MAIYRSDLLNVLEYDAFYKFGGGVSYLLDKQIGRKNIILYRIIAIVIVLAVFIFPIVNSEYNLNAWQSIVANLFFMVASTITVVTFFF